jgi:site-specific recombinase XerD
MNTTFSLLFYLKKPKNQVVGPITIYARITINSQRTEFSTGLKCHPNQWNQLAGKPIGNNEDAKMLGRYLDTINRKVHEAHRYMIDHDELITAESLKNKYSGKEVKLFSLIKVFDDHNSKMESLLGDEYAPGTLQRYQTSLMHTIAFLEWKYKVSDIDIRKVDHTFITEFEFYLRTERKCANNSAVKYIKNFGKIIRICLANGWIEKNPFVNYKSKIKEVERVFLTEEELTTITEKKFVSFRLTQVRDIFLFSCYTGLAYSDVLKLDRSQVVKGIDGDNWISTNRQKTDTRSSIPILPLAQEILDRYEDNPQCINKNKLLPILSNQKMNSYLKEITDVCHIGKEITFHTARHTFATTVTLSNGVPIETVSKMLGHKDLKITQHYAKIVDRKVSDDMKLLKQKFALKSVGNDSMTG